jgi:two-component system, OmpR family, sensor histidine kinase MprB
VSFRARLAFAVAAAVALVVVAASPVVYAIVRSELRGQVDDALRARAQSVRSHGLGIGTSPFTEKLVLRGIPPDFEGGNNYVQLYQAGTGNTYRPDFQTVRLPVNEAVREVAAGERQTYMTDAEVQGAHARMYALHGTDEQGNGYALQVIRFVGEVDRALSRIRTLLLLLDAVGILVAALLGLLVARTALGPVRRLTRTAEHVTETRDLNSRIDVHGRDELSRLATTFNTMLAALEESARAQRQLVTDASHELRTPLTSLRTNMEVLMKHEDLEQSRRRQLQAHVVEQLDELTALVAELVELARGEQPSEEPEEVQLDELVRSVVARAQRDHPEVHYEPTLEPSVIRGVPFRIERAVSNLLDNAAKWSTPGGKVEVGVHDGEVIVRDRGPGIADEDLPFVFDRFYRAPSARGMPGSGLGLAIVKQVAESHGGDVVVERPPDGGTRLRLRLTAAAGPDDSSRPAAASPMVR